MSAEGEPREELLCLVRSLRERLRIDGELGRPLSYLTREGEVAGAVRGERSTQTAREFPVVKMSGLDAVRELLGDCRRCPLHRTRHSLVFGEGNPEADLVFVGEAPGADEDAQGRPFVGRAGQLLTKIIGAMGLKREEVYICNILKCRPPGNRNPQPDEIAPCEPFLIRQLEAIRPRVICALGTFSAHTLLKSEAPISVLRGRFHSYQGILLMPTYHPAYLLRNPGAKKQVWEDVQMIMQTLRDGT
ncbi:MAG: DNA polymerase [Syntrophus sp. (in: bacteria)]|nr:DNA polymerase [Syntrophus sp. (in: bacteria)]